MKWVSRLKPFLPPPAVVAIWALGLALLALWGVDATIKVAMQEMEVTGIIAKRVNEQLDLIGRLIAVQDEQTKLDRDLFVQQPKKRGSAGSIDGRNAGSGSKDVPEPTTRDAVPLLREQVESLRREGDLSRHAVEREVDQMRSNLTIWMSILFGVGILGTAGKAWMSSREKSGSRNG